MLITIVIGQSECVLCPLQLNMVILWIEEESLPCKTAFPLRYIHYVLQYVILCYAMLCFNFKFYKQHRVFLESGSLKIHQLGFEYYRAGTANVLNVFEFQCLYGEVMQKPL